MVCTNKFFTSYRVWRTYTGERSQFWCTALIFTRSDGQCFIPPVVGHQITHYTQDLHYNIPSDWDVHNSPSGYIDHDGWHKSMSHFSYMYFFSHLNPQLLLSGVHDIHFDDRALHIFCRHHIQYFILKACDYVHDQPNYDIPNMKLNHLHGIARMDWMGHHGPLKFTLPYMNFFLV